MQAMGEKYDDRSVRFAATSVRVPAGSALAVALTGGTLVLAPPALPLRAPLVFFFLLAAPAAVLFAGLRGLDPLSRTVVALLGSMAANVLLAQLLLAAGRWSVETGLTVVTATSVAVLLGLSTLAWSTRSDTGRR